MRPRLALPLGRGPLRHMTESSVKDGRRPYLRIERLIKQFGAFTALKDISLEIFPGEFVCFLGPSGCGKTTLLRAIAGLDIQTSGRIFQADKEISNLPASQRDFGIVFQSYALFPNLTVAANVGYGLVSRGVPKVEIADPRRRPAAAGRPARVRRASTRRSSRAASSSAWRWRARWRSRRACCCSTSRCPRSTPACARTCAARSAGCTCACGVTTIMVTHDQEEALTMADRIVVMNQGVIEQVGTPTEVYRKPASAFVADFVGTTNFLPGVVVAARAACASRGIDLACELDVQPGAGHDVTLAIRPEDVVVRNVAAATPNAFPGARRRRRVPRLVLPRRARDQRRRAVAGRRLLDQRGARSRASTRASRC